jgi:hypothetical protein
MSPITPFWRKLIVISVLFEILRRLSALSTPFYTPNVVWATLGSWQNVTCHSNLTKIIRYFGAVCDTSKVRRSFHSILNAERSARHLSSSQNVTYNSILTKINRYLGPIWDISTFKLSFHSTLHAEHIARHYEQLSKCHLILDFDKN